MFDLSDDLLDTLKEITSEIRDEYEETGEEHTDREEQIHEVLKNHFGSRSNKIKELLEVLDPDLDIPALVENQVSLKPGAVVVIESTQSRKLEEGEVLIIQEIDCDNDFYFVHSDGQNHGFVHPYEFESHPASDEEIEEFFSELKDAEFDRNSYKTLFSLKNEIGG